MKLLRLYNKHEILARTIRINIQNSNLQFPYHKQTITAQRAGVETLQVWLLFYSLISSTSIVQHQYTTQYFNIVQAILYNGI